MVPHFDPKAPPFISIAQKPLGFSLRVRSVAAARERIAAFLACGDAPALVGAEVSIIEHVSKPLLQALHALPSSQRVSALDAMLEQHGHSRSDVATELWRAHGTPDELRPAYDADNQVRVQWTWVGAPERYEGWAAIAAQHTQMCRRDQALVATTGTWDLRLRLRSGEIVGEPLPASRFIPTLGGSYASAYCYFVLPEMPFTPQLTDEWDHLTARTGVKLPLSKFERCAPSRDGKGRTWSKLG